MVMNVEHVTAGFVERDYQATSCQDTVFVLYARSLSAWASDLWAQRDSAYLQEKRRKQT